MPLLNKIGGALKRMGQYYTSPEGLQTVQAMLMDYANPNAGAYAGLMRQREMAMQRQQDDAQREQYGTALSDLMSQMRGPDTMTPQVNELIGGANMRGGQVGMAPMPMQTPRRAGLDYTDPATRDAFQRFIMAGGKPEFAQGIAESMQPAPRKFVNVGGGRYGYADPETGEVDFAPPDPLQQQLLQAQIAALQAQAGQRQAQGQAAMINANRPRGSAPGAGRGGASSSGLPPGYVVR
jgi:hypothetical protein